MYVSISAGGTSVGIKGCWCSWVCVTDKRQRATLLFYLSLRWCHTDDCVLQHSGGCGRLDPCLRYTMVELKSQEHSGRIMRGCVWTIFPFKKSIKFEGPVRLNDANVDSESSVSSHFFFFCKKWKRKSNNFVQGRGRLLYFYSEPVTMLLLFFQSELVLCSTSKLARIGPGVARLSWKRSPKPLMRTGQMYLTICFIYQIKEKPTMSTLGRNDGLRSHN